MTDTDQNPFGREWKSHADENDDDAGPEWDWTKEDLEEKFGYDAENVAAYRCTLCGTISPMNFVLDFPGEELPETLRGLCGEVWGGCMDEWDDDRGNVKMELVSDGFVDWPVEDD